MPTSVPARRDRHDCGLDFDKRRDAGFGPVVRSLTEIVTATEDAALALLYGPRHKI